MHVQSRNIDWDKLYANFYYIVIYTYMCICIALFACMYIQCVCSELIHLICQPIKHVLLLFGKT